MMALTRSVACYSMSQSLTKLKDRMIGGYVLGEHQASFHHMVDLLYLYMKSSETIIEEGNLLEPDWIERLRGENEFPAVFARINGLTARTGDDFPPRLSERNLFYIDNDNSFHYVYVDKQNEVFFDAVIGFSPLQDNFKYLKRIPNWILLYDRAQGHSSVVFKNTVFGNAGIQPSLIEMKFNEKGERFKLSRKNLKLRFFPKEVNFRIIDVRKIVFIKPLDLENSEIFVLSEYPFSFGKYLFFIFGLIFIVVLALLLFVYTGVFALSSFKVTEKTADVRTSADIVNEIDTALITTRKKEQREGGGIEIKKAGKIQGTHSQLEEDGIIIKKKGE
jgi:hypothetical protein